MQWFECVSSRIPMLKLNFIVVVLGDGAFCEVIRALELCPWDESVPFRTAEGTSSGLFAVFSSAIRGQSVPPFRRR